jgi:hypothetical protein
MVQRRTRHDAFIPIDRMLVRQLLSSTGHNRRFTQDTPMPPDVWLEHAIGAAPTATRLTAHTEASDPHPKSTRDAWRSSPPPRLLSLLGRG